MIRLLLVVALVLIIFWLGRSVLADLRLLARRRRARGRGGGGQRGPFPVADRLEKDPVCGVYCPRSTAYTASWQGKTYYFCSERCRQRFLAERSSSSSA